MHTCPRADVQERCPRAAPAAAWDPSARRALAPLRCDRRRTPPTAPTTQLPRCVPRLQHLCFLRHGQPVDLAIERRELLLLGARAMPIERVLRRDGERAERESVRDRLRRIAALIARRATVR